MKTLITKELINCDICGGAMGDEPLTSTDWFEGQPMRIIAWAKKDLKDTPPNIPSMDVIKEHLEGAL